jgi:hypothetical protein
MRPHTVNHFYYPGWGTHVEDTGWELAVQHDADGLLEIAAPASTYTGILSLEKRAPEKFGAAISLCFLLVLIALASLSGAGKSPPFLKCASPGQAPESELESRLATFGNLQRVLRQKSSGLVWQTRMLK